MLNPGWLNNELWSAMRCPIARRRFLGLLGVAGLGAYVSAHAWSIPDNFHERTVESPRPTFDRDTYRLAVSGLVRRPLNFTYRQLLILPSSRQTCDFRCIEGWGVDDVPWEGIQLRTLMTMARPLADARFVTFHCLDNVYSESLSLEQAGMSHALLAYCMYGHPLPAEHGSPLRLVFPRMLGYKSAKWVTRVEFRAEQDYGYWEGLGAPLDAWVQNQQPCSASGFGGCGSCRLEAWREQIRHWRTIATPTSPKTSLPAETIQGGSGCGTQP